MMKLLLLFVGLFCLANAIPARKVFRGHAVDDDDKPEFRDIGSNLEVRSIDEILNTERFKNIPVIFLEDAPVRHLGRNVPKKKNHNQRRVASNRFHDEVKPLIKRTHDTSKPVRMDLPERLRNIPLIFADQSFAFPQKFKTRNNIELVAPEKPHKLSAFDEDEDEEDEDNFDMMKDDEDENDNMEDEEEEEPMPMPVVRRPVNRHPYPMMGMNPARKTPYMQQYMMQMRPENFNFRRPMNGNRQKTVSTVKTNPSDVIELPIPKKLDIVAFITRDGSIYEIDTVNDNSPMPISDKETSTLKDILKKTIAVKNVMASENVMANGTEMKDDKMEKDSMSMMMEDKDKDMSMGTEKTEAVATDSTPSEETVKSTKKTEKVEVETIKVRK